MSAAFSPIMIDGALVLPDVSVGMIEASATRDLADQRIDLATASATCTKPI
jgi:hypothetical protein